MVGAGDGQRGGGAAAFAAAVVAELPATTARPPELVDALACAAAAWPDVELVPADFAAHLAPRLTASTPASRLHVADLYLACACLRADPSALRHLQRDYLDAVPRLLTSYPGLLADEVRALLPSRLCVNRADRPAGLARYSGRASLRAWLKIVVLHCACDLQRQQRPTVSIDESPRLLEALVGDEERRGNDWPRARLRAALAAAVKALTDEQRVLLHGYFVERLTLEQLSAPARVHSATTFHRLKRIYAEVRDRVEATLCDDLELSAGACRSLIRSLLSQLDLHLSTLLERPRRDP